MKPAFALDLDTNAVRLLNRSGEGWLEVGKVDLNAEDLDGALKDLRKRASELAPDGFVTKLILPLSQILYTNVETQGNNRANQRADIVNALKGRTPYPVADLVFDWSRSGSQARVAVVARITLDEAEAFAEGYGFNPVSFVAVPPSEKFGGEPFFGLTSGAAAHLPEGLRLDRDQDPVRVLGTLPAPAAGATVEAIGAAEDITPEAGPAVIAESMAIADPVPEVEPEVAAEAKAARADTPEATTVPEAPAASESVAADAGEAEPAPEPDESTPDLRADAAPPDTDTADMAPEDQDIDLSGDAPARPLDPTDDAPAEDAPARAAAEEAPFIAVEEEDGDAISILAESLPELDSAPVPPAFQTRRVLLAQRPEDEEDLRSAANRLHLVAPPPVPDMPAPRIPEGMASITAPILDVPPLPADDEAASVAARKPRSALGRAALGAIPDAAHGTLAQQKLRRAGVALPPLIAPIAGPTNAPAQQKAKPPVRPVTPANRTRTLVILSGILILGMVAIALGSIFVSGGGTTPVAGVQTPAETEATAPAITPDSAAPEVTEPQIEDIVPPSDVTDTETEIVPDPPAAAETDTGIASDGQSSTDAAVATALGAAGTDATATEIVPPPTVAAPRDVPLNAPTASPQPEADAAGAPTISDASPGPGDVAGPADLPDTDVARADNPPLPQPLPPPFGTVVTFDPSGLIVPTPDGVITPGGFTLFAGKPPLLPPTRPGSAEPAAAPPTAPATTDPAAAPAPPAPASVAPEDGAALAPETTPVVPPASELPRVGPRPKARPAVVVALASAARSKADALAEAAAAAAKAEAERTASATPQAVASSRRPAGRPSDLSKAVEAAVAAAVATPTPAAAPAPEPAPVVTAAAASEQEIDEPEPETAAPNMPTSVTVSRQATVKNALNLGEISLIGVFGSSSSRRALIRMPSGRFIKVKVGDRFDGGTIAAIGDSEVSYVKRGQTVVLKMVKKS